LSEVLPSVFRELNAYCAQNLEGFDRREYISSNLWLVCILLIQSDLEVSLTGSLVKEFEVVLSPFLEICEQTLILKAHSNKTSLASLIEQEKESESEDLEIEEMVESLTLDTPLKIEPLALVANKVEEVRASNLGNSLPRHLEKPKEKQRKEREKISAQDLLSLRGKNIRLIFKLLEEAGYKKGASGFLEKDGKKLSLNIMTTSQNKTRELVQVFLQDQWKKIGIELSINNEPARVFFGETVKKAAYPGMAMYAWVSSPDNPPRSTLHSKEIPTQENGWNGQNSGGWSNKRVDELLVNVFKEFDASKRKVMMDEVQKIYTDEVPVMPLYMRADVAVVPANLKGFKMPGHQFHSTLNVDSWSLDGSGQGH
jgi:hypothetical protein